MRSMSDWRRHLEEERQSLVGLRQRILLLQGTQHVVQDLQRGYLLGSRRVLVLRLNGSVLSQCHLRQLQRGSQTSP